MYTLATLYSPNTAQISFIEEALSQLQDFAEVTVILGGDFNVTIHPDLDSTGQHPQLTFPALRRLRKCLFKHQMVDSWRVMNPSGRDYSFYSPPHGSYSRIDLILLKHHDLPRVTGADIGSIHLSDHAPVSLDFDFYETRRAPLQWRLNESLLLDAAIKTDVEKELADYFSTNLTLESSLVNVWEAHKPVIRGVFIKHGSRLKKEREHQSQALLSDIHVLEIDHKSTQDRNLLTELTILREKYKSITLHKVKGHLQKCRKHFYVNSDRCGRSLARALRDKFTQSYIPEVIDSRGVKTSLPEAITTAFKDYYGAPYNIAPGPTKGGLIQQRLKIRDFLRGAEMPRIPEEVTQTL